MEFSIAAAGAEKEEECRSLLSGGWSMRCGVAVYPQYGRNVPTTVP